MADKAYDTNAIIDFVEDAGINPVIPSKKNRKIQRVLDNDLYALRHIIENTFQKFKEWRGIATRYAKNTRSYMGRVSVLRGVADVGTHLMTTHPSILTF